MSTRPSSGVLSVNVASLCDWTSVSTDYIHNIASVQTLLTSRDDLLRNIAMSSSSYPVAQQSNRKTYLRPWLNANQERSSSTGRMFIKEKITLTKGEREIIAGICENRGDLRAVDRFRGSVDGKKLLSHRDAWLVGKQIPRPHPLMSYEDTVLSPTPVVPSRSSRASTPANSQNNCGCLSCNPAQCICRDCLTNVNAHQEGIDTHSFGHNSSDTERYSSDDDCVPSAPPTTPEHTTSPRTGPKPKVPPINSGSGTVLVKQILHKNDNDVTKRRTLVDVYLPRLDSNVQDQCFSKPPESRVCYSSERLNFNVSGIKRSSTTNLYSSRAPQRDQSIYNNRRVGHISTRIQMSMRRPPSQAGACAVVGSAPSIVRPSSDKDSLERAQYYMNRPPSAAF